jgi:uncharacterized SAM-binding protein YcdF (DUF218 family)
MFVVDNASKDADAIVVLGGSNETRVDKAIELLKFGYSSKIFMTEPEEKTKKYPFIQTQREVAELIFREHNVSFETIPSLKGRATSTIDEAFDLAFYLKNRDFKRIILVTDEFHTARSLYAFEKIFKSEGLDVKVEVSGAKSKIYNRFNWWESEQGLLDYIPEFFKFTLYFIILNIL